VAHMGAERVTPEREPTEPFAVLLQQHRHTAGLSQAELAERAGLSQRAISDLERGLRKAPYPATIRRLAEALELSEPARRALLAASRRAKQAPPVPALDIEPALEPPSAAHQRLHNLPREVTSFIGRGGDLLELRRLAAFSQCLTLTGPGGV